MRPSVVERKRCVRMRDLKASRRTRRWDGLLDPAWRNVCEACRMVRMTVVPDRGQSSCQALNDE